MARPAETYRANRGHVHAGRGKTRREALRIDRALAVVPVPEPVKEEEVAPKKARKPRAKKLVEVA